MILKVFISRRTRKNQTQEVLYMVVRESLAEEVICGIKHKQEDLAIKKNWDYKEQKQEHFLLSENKFIFLKEQNESQLIWSVQSCGKMRLERRFSVWKFYLFTLFTCQAYSNPGLFKSQR